MTALSLGQFVAAERLRRGIATTELARLAGYAQVAKGVKRIERFEATSNEVRPFVERLFEALGVALIVVEQQLAEQKITRNERLVERWLLRRSNSVGSPLVVVRCFAGCYSTHRLPHGVTTVGHMIEYARIFSRRVGLQTVVRLNDARFVLVDQQGRIAHVGRS